MDSFVILTRYYNCYLVSPLNIPLNLVFSVLRMDCMRSKDISLGRKCEIIHRKRRLKNNKIKKQERKKREDAEDASLQRSRRQRDNGNERECLAFNVSTSGPSRGSGTLHRRRRSPTGLKAPRAVRYTTHYRQMHFTFMNVIPRDAPGRRCAWAHFVQRQRSAEEWRTGAGNGECGRARGSCLRRASVCFR